MCVGFVPSRVALWAMCSRSFRAGFSRLALRGYVLHSEVRLHFGRKNKGVCFVLLSVCTNFAVVTVKKERYSQMKVQIVNHSHHPLPVYATPQSAGLDLRASLEESIVLKPLERVMVPTGLFVALPVGYEGQVRPRSGLAAKHGITVLNSPGTVDSDYRGELRIILVNLSNEPFVINDGERIAQLIVTRHEQVEWEPVGVLDETERGTGGFGHTGVK